MANAVEHAEPVYGRRHPFTIQTRQTIEAYIGLTPYLAGFLIFTLGPILYSLYLSFTDYDVLSPPKWIGAANYVKMFTVDNLIPHSLWITFKYTIVAVPAGVVVGYALGLLLNEKAVGLSFWRTAFYMPSVVPALATAYLFMWLLQADYGLINTALRAVGLPAPKWWGDPDTVIWCFILMALWGAGGGVILYLSSLQGVPTDLYDAAKVDGANAWQRFRHVTLPMTSPVIFFTFLTGMIASFQVFTQVFVSSNGGPANGSLFYMLYLYRIAWTELKMGYAAAMAWVLFLILLVLTVLVLRLSGRLVYYAGEERN
jgi:multiple sugar transport system permease protein